MLVKVSVLNPNDFMNFSFALYEIRLILYYSKKGKHNVTLTDNLYRLTD